MDFKAYLAIGEENDRHTLATTVGYLPLTDFKLPEPGFKTKKRGEFRGQSSRLGHRVERRQGTEVKGSFTFPLFSEAGTAKGIVATIFKHLLAHATTVQNAATGQYASIIYGVSNPWDDANLGTKALSLLFTFMQGDVLKVHPVLGARPTKIKISQKPSEDALCTVDFVAQEYGTIDDGVEIDDTYYPAENLRCDHQMFRLYTGAVIRTGDAPDFTNIAQDNATPIAPDEFEIEIDAGYKDKMVLNGKSYPSKTNVGIITGKATMKIDFEDPASGFSSVAEYLAWRAGVSELNLLAVWDTGVQAGAGLNHQVVLDVPRANRVKANPEIKQSEDPTIPLEYDFHYDDTALYAIAALFINTADTV